MGDPRETCEAGTELTESVKVRSEGCAVSAVSDFSSQHNHHESVVRLETVSMRCSNMWSCFPACV